MRGEGRGGGGKNGGFGGRVWKEGRGWEEKGKLVVQASSSIPKTSPGGRCQNKKIAKKPVKIQRKIQQDALGKIKRIKEISRRE